MARKNTYYELPNKNKKDKTKNRKEHTDKNT